MYNPVRKNEYARNAGKMFKTELQAYKRINSPLLVGYDEFHALLLLKKQNLSMYQVLTDLSCA